MKKLHSKLAILMLCLSLFVPALANAHEVDTNGAAPNLQAALGELLGEHALLAVIAMQRATTAQRILMMLQPHSARTQMISQPLSLPYTAVPPVKRSSRSGPPISDIL